MGIKDFFSKIVQRQVPSQKEIEQQAQDFMSREYQTFVAEASPEEEKGFLQWYRNAAKFSYKILKFHAPQKTASALSSSIEMTELDVTPDEVFSFAIFTIFTLTLAASPILLLGDNMVLIVFLLPPMLAYMLFTYPSYQAAVTKIKASDETVKIILYMVIYLRLNPQIEGAMRFAAAHSSGPIGRDLKKIIWDLQVRRFVTVNEAISSKISKWLLWDKEFVESMNLLQALSLETVEANREKTLDKTLTYILDSTYEKMKQYSRDLATPIMLIHTMGITFPIMGLVMFPMISIFLHNTFNPNYLIVGYIAILPGFNYFYLRRTISKRPGAFAYPDISSHPDLPPEGKIILTFSGKKYLVSVLPIALVVTFLLLLPGIAYFYDLGSAWYKISQVQDPEQQSQLWKDRISIEYKPDVSFYYMMFSLSTIWAAGAGLAIYFYGSSYQRVQIRNQVKFLEDEFQIGLFRLGDVLTAGIPVETALEETLEKYRQYKLESSPMFSFFQTILKNIKQMGMTFKSSVFDRQYGVIIRYPSILIRDVMGVLVSASEKSSAILSSAAKTISTFLMKTKNVENLLKELLDEVAAAIALQSNFIAPFIAGIVGAMATFIIQLLQKMAEFLAKIETQYNIGGSLVQGGTLKITDMLSFSNIEQVMPATVFQLVVGIYMIETVITLAYFLNGIKNGFDRTTRNLLIGKSLIIGLVVYSIVLIVGIFISASILPTISSSLGGEGGIINVG
jgi:hypothetical protein